MVKENFIYVGIDLHKETHTAVMIDCYNQKLGEITFPNRPADFPKLVTKVKKCNTDGKEVVYGLENAYGYGRALAVWLIDKGYFVKDVNTAISHRQAKHRGAMYRKSESQWKICGRNLFQSAIINVPPGPAKKSWMSLPVTK